jgi:alpha-beta hydrolase superfamily lysophospholipase
MASNVFEVSLPNGHVQKGMAYTAEGTTKNLLIMTGMNEHATRYENLAQYFNSSRIRRLCP